MARDRGTLSRGEWGACSNGLLIWGGGCHRGQASNRLSQKGLCPWATMEGILKDAGADGGRTFFPESRGGRLRQEGEGGVGRPSHSPEPFRVKQGVSASRARERRAEERPAEMILAASCVLGSCPPPPKPRRHTHQHFYPREGPLFHCPDRSIICRQLASKFHSGKGVGRAPQGP